MGEASTRQRLAAILAADVSGYSRLMACNEPRTVSALDAAREVFARHIAAHQGRVIDMAGDSVLAVFETAVGAVLAAMAVQDEIARRSAGQADDCRMRFRVGIHLGDVIEKSNGSVYGDGVNTAARLETLAGAGGVCVSEAVECALRHRVPARFEDMGPQMLKNLPKPVRAYRLRPRQRRPRLWPRRTSRSTSRPSPCCPSTT
jgi:adenylate cyclase